MEKEADPLEAAEYTLEEWKVVWRVGEKMQEGPRPWEQGPRQELEDIKEEDTDRPKEVARTFRRRAGLGVDRWRPSVLQGACEEACSRLLDILRVVECALIWPVHMATVLFCIAPNAFTTDRVIGLLPTIRAWEIMREPCVIKWAKEHQRSRGCTSHEKAAEDAAWDVLLSHEMDNPDNESEESEATITAVLDMGKAFEK
eukprot:1081840-Pyramimonas_sp.AAC.1